MRGPARRYQGVDKVESSTSDHNSHGQINDLRQQEFDLSGWRSADHQLAGRKRSRRKDAGRRFRDLPFLSTENRGSPKQWCLNILLLLGHLAVADQGQL